LKGSFGKSRDGNVGILQRGFPTLCGHNDFIDTLTPGGVFTLGEGRKCHPKRLGRHHGDSGGNGFYSHSYASSGHTPAQGFFLAVLSSFIAWEYDRLHHISYVNDVVYI